MKLTNLKINDLITPEAKLTFLVGAGCSIDPPSCLPNGKEMMKAIIEYTCAESEVDKISELDDLRFEQLIEIVRENGLDKDLKIIDYYGQCDQPNLQHFFLAEMIKNGHFVMTTNFDFLIEFALQELGASNEQIVPIITRDDFETFQDPYKLFNQGKKAIYKVHGSTRNVITKEDTRESLVATIQALGSNKEGENVFQLEPFKRPVFINLTKNRSLVVMGYSGSDDFDIVPTLKILNIPAIIWINHSKDIEKRNEEIHEIDVNTIALDDLDKKLMQMRNADHVYRVDVNTTDMVKQLLQFKPKLSSKDFWPSLHDWLMTNLAIPNNFIKYYISFKIYRSLDIYDGAMACSEKILQLAKELQDKSWESIALNNIGMIYNDQGNYPEALERYEEALKIAEQLGDLKEKARSFNNIGEILREQRNYPKALERYEEALKIAKQLGELRGESTCLNNIGAIHYAQGNYPEALKQYEEVLQIAEQLGDLKEKAMCLNNIGMIYKAQGNYPEALRRYEEALQITEQLGQFSKVATVLNNIAVIHEAQKNYLKAMKLYEKSLQINEQLGNLSGKANTLMNTGWLYASQRNYPEALKRYQEAVDIAEQLEDLRGKADRLKSIAAIRYVQRDYQDALKQLEEALEILIELGLKDSQDAQDIIEGINMIKSKLSLD